jgi:hypothetical protein
MLIFAIYVTMVIKNIEIEENMIKRLS